MNPLNTGRPDLKPPGLSQAEWDARVELAALYRAVHLYGMTDLIYNHITARVPGEPEHVLINPFGLLYKEVSASNLYKIRLDGEIIDKPDDGLGINRAAIVIHTAVHAARHDAACVIHTHTRASTAVSAMECGLLPISQQSHMFYDRIGYHEFSGPVNRLEQQAKLVQDLGTHNAVMLRNHGLLVCGETIAHTFFLLYWLESACKIQVDAMSGGKLVTPSRSSVDASHATFDKPHLRGELEWAAVRRELDRLDPSYRH